MVVDIIKVMVIYVTVPVRTCPQAGCDAVAEKKLEQKQVSIYNNIMKHVFKNNIKNTYLNIVSFDIK
jgi:hypothetical protein